MEILYQDDDILMVDKPAGLPVLPDGWDKDSPYLVKLLEEQFGRLWVVHRLDKVTSGVLVLARSAQAHRSLNLQFERHEAQKVYHAVCVGAPTWDEHTARHKLRVNVGHSHRTAVDHSHGKPAQTHFKLLKRYPAHGWIEARPATGRTHQIRVHAYALGHPLLGDSLYSALATPTNTVVASNLIDRPALHAFSLTITHPVSNERLTFSAPHPPDFAAVLTKLNKEL